MIILPAHRAPDEGTLDAEDLARFQNHIIGKIGLIATPFTAIAAGLPSTGTGVMDTDGMSMSILTPYTGISFGVAGGPILNDDMFGFQIQGVRYVVGRRNYR